MIEIKPMDESYILIDCLHHGPVNPSLPPRRGNEWQDAQDLPPHPWSDETIVELAKKYTSITEGWRGDPAREFMREMIQRYGTCAILAWEEEKVVGILCQSDLIAQQKKFPVPSLFSFLDGYIALTSKKHLEKEVQKIAATTVDQAMAPDPVTVQSETTIEEVAALMVDEGFHTLPVVESGRLVGIIGKEDILKLLISESKIFSRGA